MTRKHRRPPATPLPFRWTDLAPHLPRDTDTGAPLGARRLAALLNRNWSSISRMQTIGISLAQAEHIADRLDTHPACIWPSYVAYCLTLPPPTPDLWDTP